MYLIVLEIILFLILVFIWYLLGAGMIGGFSDRRTGIVGIASVATGIAVFIWLSYITQLLRLPFLFPFLVVFGLYRGVVSAVGSRRFVFWGWSRENWWLLPGVLVFSIPMLVNGYSEMGLVLRGANSADSVWNMALTNSLTLSFPPQHPAIAGLPLTGYHFLYNLWLSEIVKYFGIDQIRLYFWYIPLLLAVLLLYGFYYIGVNLTGSRRAAVWGTLMSVLGGSFAFAVALFYRQDISLDGSLGITQPVSLQISPSFTISLIYIIYGLIFLHRFIKTGNLYLAVTLALIMGLLPGLKVYAAMIFFPAFAVYALYRFLRRGKTDLIYTGILAALLAAVVFVPFNASYGFLVYQFMWPPHRVMQGTLDFTLWELKRQTLAQLGSKLGLLKLEVIAFLVFLIGNLGTRIIGILFLPFSRQKFDRLMYGFLWMLIFFAFVPPLFFIQPIGAFNMIQMFWYYLFWAGFLGGIGIYYLLKIMPNKSRILLAVIIIALTLPSAYEVIATNIRHQDGASVSSANLRLYQVLAAAGSKTDVVLEIPDLPIYTRESVYAWAESSLPAIPAYTGKMAFLGGEVVQFKYEELIRDRVTDLDIILAPNRYPPLYRPRRVEKQALSKLKENIDKYNLRYIVSKNKYLWFKDRPWITLIYEDGSAVIYEINRQQMP